MANTLYIIGNGFDLYHGLPTSYQCFLCFMLRKYYNDEKRLGYLFDRNNPNKLWSNFESQLETPDFLNYVQENLGRWLIMSEKDFDNEFANIHAELQDFFMQWVQQITMNMYNGKRLRLDTDAYFLTFNYTNLLEKAYGVNPKMICYIHGNTLTNSSYKPVTGHSGQVNPLKKQKCDICRFVRSCGRKPYWAISNERFAEIIIEALNELWLGLAKCHNPLINRPYDEITNYYINEHLSNFKNYKNLSDIYVLGHSLAVADRDYFEYIYHSSPNAKWHLSVRNLEEETNKKNDLYRLLNIEVTAIKCDAFTMDSMLLK